LARIRIAASAQDGLSATRFKRDVRFALRERFGGDTTAFQVAWLYDYDVGRELG